MAGFEPKSKNRKMKDFKKLIQNLMPGSVRFNEPMSRHTSFRVGGPADIFVEPENIESLTQLMDYVRKTGLEYMVIGRGTNILVKDSGIRGVVIVLNRLNKIAKNRETRESVLVTAMAGAGMQAFCRFAIATGSGGMNFAVGIPGSVGGGIMMNAGTRKGCIQDVLESVTLLKHTGMPVKIDRQNMKFSYRNLEWSGLRKNTEKGQPVLLECLFSLYHADPGRLKAEAHKILEARNINQPTDQPSAGCFFKNPELHDKTAGELIQLAGLKGKRIRGAQISARHANFIVNTKTASANDILELKDFVQETVLKKFNIELKPEVKIVG